ncbi:hypothetical protein BBM40_19565 [Vibrio parahaemolyticus]|uniref:J domain-containing protein n=1 Tax=Vibrio parahaemolyticus TaxID=670 RepID=UPI00084BA719|nr:J domain-containing protein [Vibrio parahaemolyticus]ODZ45292.1 hypothetical protein BBM40_19565 [Vibrio parahaemolyticus]
MNYYSYTVLKRNDEFLAVIQNQNTYWELGHYYEQGYTYFMDVSAFNANSAVEIAKQNENSEIGRLQAELASLRQQYQELLNENSRLKFSNNRSFTVPSNNIDPLEVLGFREMPSASELKNSYRSLSHKLHKDKGGNDFLMRMIKEAYDTLSKQTA